MEKKKLYTFLNLSFNPFYASCGCQQCGRMHRLQRIVWPFSHFYILQCLSRDVRRPFTTWMVQVLATGRPYDAYKLCP